MKAYAEEIGIVSRALDGYQPKEDSPRNIAQHFELTCSDYRDKMSA